MKYNSKEIQKALDMIKKDNGTIEVEINIDPRDKLLIEYTNSVTTDVTVITIFNTEVNMMPTITKTSRL